MHMHQTIATFDPQWPRLGKSYGDSLRQVWRDRLFDPESLKDHSYKFLQRQSPAGQVKSLKGIVE